MLPQDHIVSILRSFDIEPGPMDHIIADHFRRHRELSSVMRRLVADTCWGVMRWRRRLDGWIAMSGHKKPDAKLRAAAYSLWKEPSQVDALGLGDLSRSIQVPSDPDAMPKGFPGGESAFLSFPQFMYDDLVSSRGRGEAVRLMLALNSQASPCIRVNTARVDRDSLAKEFAAEGIECEPTKVSPYGIRLARRASLESLSSFRNGLFEVQDEASQLVALLASGTSGARVLDACAGAGGKSLMLAMLDASSEIVASDVDEAKLLELSRRAKRAGVSNIRTLSASRVEDEIAKGGKFDVIMVDAPCSGTGTIRRSPDIKYRIDGSVVGGRLEVQRELLEKNLRYLKKDGRIVYATCSVLSSENEGIVQPFISKSGLQNVSAGEIFCALGVDISKIVDRSGYFRTNPADGDWDGFFAAVMINN